MVVWRLVLIYGGGGKKYVCINFQISCGEIKTEI